MTIVIRSVEDFAPFSGSFLSARARVAISTAAANVDPDMFPDPLPGLSADLDQELAIKPALETRR
jgi:hypothetical protein